MSIGRKVASLRAMSPADRRRCGRALYTLAWLGPCLRLAGLTRCQRWLARRAGGTAVVRGAKALERAHEHAWALAVAVRNVPWRVRCLERSLALWWLLARDGISAEMRIGVRKLGRGIEAHAWVEVQGHPLDTAKIDQTYAPFPSPLLDAATEVPLQPPRPGGR